MKRLSSNRTSRFQLPDEVKSSNEFGRTSRAEPRESSAREESPPPSRAPAERDAGQSLSAQAQEELRAQLKTKADMLNWITRSRSWRYTAWLRRVNFLSLNLRQRLPLLPERDTFHGALELPAEGDRVPGRIKIKGWAYSEGSRVICVEAFLDTISLGLLRYGLTRLDAAAYPSRAPIRCGYEGTLDIDESLAGRRRLTVRVRDVNGRVKDYEREVFIGPPSCQPGPKRAAADGADSPAAAPPAPAAPPDALSLAKKTLEAISRVALESLLVSDSVIEFPRHDSPRTSILLVLYNRAELTLQCLHSILRHHTAPYEVIIVDNASTDETASLLKRVKGARVVRNETNVHYLHACNQAARLARGRYLLLLNNDAQMLGDCITAAVETLNSAPDIGAVGGCILLPDGSLQEAGSIVWNDGSCSGYGRGRAPFTPEFMFRRNVDYCSAVFLLTRRDLFLGLGGFDEAFAPAYYEDTDYCARLWEKGLRVVYDPRVSVLHYEFASSGSQGRAQELQASHRPVFTEKHGQWLRSRLAPAPDSELHARSHRLAGQKRILYVDDRVPHRNLGSGFPRSNRIIAELVRMGHEVTCYPVNSSHEDWVTAYSDLPREVEVIMGHGLLELQEFLAEREGYYDILYVSRPHNMAGVRQMLARHPQIFSGVKIVFDSESLFSRREMERLRVRGKAVSESERARRLGGEVLLAEGCHSVISVSETECREFTQHGISNVHALGHALEAAPTPSGFDERRDILFVGAVHEAGSPNADSVAWFSKQVLPLVRRELGDDVKLLVAGHASQEFFASLNNGRIKVLGRVEDLTGLYDRARLFVAPTRFSAGLPYKAHEAAAHGLPMVATTPLGRQLGWRHEEELLLADDAKDFAAACVKLYSDRLLWERLRRGALMRVETDCCPAKFAEQLRAIIE